jgi:hypothetical protein
VVEGKYVEPNIWFVFIFTVDAVDSCDVFPDNMGMGMVIVDVC